jgi:lycopene cyclase domain-containing protein
MTYLSFLALFLVVPLGLVAAGLMFMARQGRPLSSAAPIALLAHIALAVAYTTPWDNYLVATRVWAYDPARVLGVTFGWVPLEEYLFFVLQTLLSGLIALALARRLPTAGLTPSGRPLRTMAALALAAVWFAAVLALAAAWKPGTYLALVLVWALPPIALQVAVGGDVLWRNRRAVLAALLSVTLFLSAADFLAIRAGIWTIDPRQSLNLFLGGGLPIEEVVFFLLTNMLVVFGLTLSLAPEMWERWGQLKAAFVRRPRMGEGA